jgi:molybdopterin-binding protein
MKLSARNVLSATVKAVTPGAVDTEVVVELVPGIEMVSINQAIGRKTGAQTRL